MAYMRLWLRMPPYYIQEVISFHSCDLLCLTVRNIIYEVINIPSFLPEHCSVFPNGSHRFSVMTLVRKSTIDVKCVPPPPPPPQIPNLPHPFMKSELTQTM